MTLKFLQLYLPASLALVSLLLAVYLWRRQRLFSAVVSLSAISTVVHLSAFLALVPSAQSEYPQWMSYLTYLALGTSVLAPFLNRPGVAASWRLKWNLKYVVLLLLYVAIVLGFMQTENSTETTHRYKMLLHHLSYHRTALLVSAAMIVASMFYYSKCPRAFLSIIIAQGIVLASYFLMIYDQIEHTRALHWAIAPMAIASCLFNFNGTFAGRGLTASVPWIAAIQANRWRVVVGGIIPLMMVCESTFLPWMTTAVEGTQASQFGMQGIASVMGGTLTCDGWNSSLVLGPLRLPLALTTLVCVMIGGAAYVVTRRATPIPVRRLSWGATVLGLLIVGTFLSITVIIPQASSGVGAWMALAAFVIQLWPLAMEWNPSPEISSADGLLNNRRYRRLLSSPPGSLFM